MTRFARASLKQPSTPTPRWLNQSFYCRCNPISSSPEYLPASISSLAPSSQNPDASILQIRHSCRQVRTALIHEPSARNRASAPQIAGRRAMTGRTVGPTEVGIAERA